MWKVLGCVTCIFVVLAWISSNTSKPATVDKQAVDAAMFATAVAVCRDQLDRRRAEYDSLMAKGAYRDAALAFGSCGTALGDPAVKGLVSAAEVKHYIKVGTDPKSTLAERDAALGLLSRDFPELAKPYEKLRHQIHEQFVKAEEREKRRQVAAELVRKRSHGVHLGMSTDDALLSSWGKPNKINRTTNVRGTSEQWVYDGGYLYFENGILTSIQN